MKTWEEAATLLQRWANGGHIPSDEECREAFNLAIAALRSPAPGAAAMREAAARAVEKLYRTEPDKIDEGYDTEQVGHRVRRRCAAAIRALPAPDVPECVRRFCLAADDRNCSVGEMIGSSAALRDWIRKEYGL